MQGAPPVPAPAPAPHTAPARRRVYAPSVGQRPPSPPAAVPPTPPEKPAVPRPAAASIELKRSEESTRARPLPTTADALLLSQREYDQYKAVYAAGTLRCMQTQPPTKLRALLPVSAVGRTESASPPDSPDSDDINAPVPASPQAVPAPVTARSIRVRSRRTAARAHSPPANGGGGEGFEFPQIVAAAPAPAAAPAAAAEPTMPIVTIDSAGKPTRARGKRIATYDPRRYSCSDAQQKLAAAVDEMSSRRPVPALQISNVERKEWQARNGRVRRNVYITWKSDEFGIQMRTDRLDGALLIKHPAMRQEANRWLQSFGFTALPERRRRRITSDDDDRPSPPVSPIATGEEEEKEEEKSESESDDEGSAEEEIGEDPVQLVLRALDDRKWTAEEVTAAAICRQHNLLTGTEVGMSAFGEPLRHLSAADITRLLAVSLPAVADGPRANNLRVLTIHAVRRNEYGEKEFGVALIDYPLSEGFEMARNGATTLQLASWIGMPGDGSDLSARYRSLKVGAEKQMWLAAGVALLHSYEATPMDVTDRSDARKRVALIHGETWEKWKSVGSSRGKYDHIVSDCKRAHAFMQVIASFDAKVSEQFIGQLLAAEDVSKARLISLVQLAIKSNGLPAAIDALKRQVQTEKGPKDLKRAPRRKGMSATPAAAGGCVTSAQPPVRTAKCAQQAADARAASAARSPPRKKRKPDAAAS